MRSRAVRFCLVLAAASLLLGGCSVFQEVGSWFATNGKKSNLRGVRIPDNDRIWASIGAKAVIDASGTYRSPNSLASSGLEPLGLGCHSSSGPAPPCASDSQN